MSKQDSELDPSRQAEIQAIFEKAGFITELGIKLVAIGPGWCESRLTITPRHYQHHTFIHAGVQATMADHTAGGAATTMLKAGETVLTVEFKINLLRPAVGESLRCKAAVLRAGRTLIIAESEVFAQNSGQEKLVAKVTVTLAVVQADINEKAGN